MFQCMRMPLRAEFDQEKGIGGGQGFSDPLRDITMPPAGKAATQPPAQPLDVAAVLKAPAQHSSLLRELALGHRDSETRWKAVSALATLPQAAHDLAFLANESADLAVRSRADRAVRPIIMLMGKTVMTRTAMAELNPADMQKALERHSLGDWGDLCREDWEANERALREGSRLFSVFHDRAGTKFYIITEWDRSVTTILLPEDY